MSLEVEVGGLKLKNPMVGASGLWGFGDEYAEVIDLSLFGAVITKTITLRPREGNPPPRVVDLGHGMINSIGLENPGIDWFIGEKLDTIDIPCELIVSIGGDSVEDYRVVASRLAGRGGIAALEVNISCPNVSKGGILFGRDPDATSAVIEAVRGEIDIPIIAKLPPLPGCIEDVAGAARGAGADALGVSNTLPSISIDIEAQRPRLGGRTGGLSGPPLKPVALYLVYRLAASADIPIIGIGGIETSSDAIEFMLAGASAFEIGSVIVKWLNAPSDIIMGIEEYMADRGYKAIEEFRGKALA
ncbi:MAG: dihydroorotate dehydrogenase [bacterium]|jgi:dihydroorotate dehydrogenase (NAD+) catalytic subunit